MEGQTIDGRSLMMMREMPLKLKLLKKLLLLNIFIQAAFIPVEIGEDAIVIFLGGYGIVTFIVDLITIIGLILLSYISFLIIKNDNKYKYFIGTSWFLSGLLIFTSIFDIIGPFFPLFLLVAIWELFLGIYIIYIIKNKDIISYFKFKNDRSQQFIDVPALTSSATTITVTEGPSGNGVDEAEKKGAETIEHEKKGSDTNKAEKEGPQKEVDSMGSSKDELIFCQDCGFKNIRTAQFCNKCGKKIELVGD